MAKQAKFEDSNPMDVVEISTGTTPDSWDLAQMHPPGAQQPGIDPFAKKKVDPEDLDAGARWPREPGGPRLEDEPVTMSAIGTTGQATEQTTESTVVTPEKPEPGVESKKGGSRSSK